MQGLVSICNIIMSARTEHINWYIRKTHRVVAHVVSQRPPRWVYTKTTRYMLARQAAAVDGHNAISYNGRPAQRPCTLRPGRPGPFFHCVAGTDAWKRTS